MAATLLGAASPALAQIDTALAAQLATDAPVIDLLASDSRTCARLRDGSWKCWGEALLGSGSGQCGTDHTVAACDPTPVATFPASFRYLVPKTSGCGVEMNGSVQCWGAWGDGSANRVTIDAPAGARVLGLSSDQLCVGASNNKAACRRLKGKWKDLPYDDIVSLAVSDTRIGLVRHAHVLTVGDGERWHDYNLPTRTVLFGPQVTYALSRNWGAFVIPDEGEPHGLPGLERVVHLAADPSTQHVCASIGAAVAGVSTTGAHTVRCSGSNNAGQLGLGDMRARTSFEDIPGLDGAMRVAVGAQHSCALTVRGEVYCWGANNLGQLGVKLEQGEPAVIRAKGKGTLVRAATGLSPKASMCANDLPCSLVPVRVPID